MRTRTWLPVLLTGSSLALASCGDDVTVSSATSPGSSGTSGGDPTTTAVDSTSASGVDSTGETTGPPMPCGDGTLELGEECDDANAEDGDGCSMECTIEEGYLCQGQPSECIIVCGDGQVIGDEECDDDNVLDGDGCTAECGIEPGYACEGMPSECTIICGDGLVLPGEECDDANTDADDGCSGCVVEDGYGCTNDEPSMCSAICGDGQILGDEECDDFNLTPDDGCSEMCMVELGWSCGGEPSVCMTGCGDGIPAGMEGCDDGALLDGDGCSADCQPESGWVCMGSPSVCMTECGDGLIAGIEECDDGNLDVDDGCSDVCGLEFGFECAGEPSACISVCGDGILVPGETCDDGNISQGDGCSLTCQSEFGWDCVGAPSACTLTGVLDQLALGIDGGCVLSTTGEVGCFGANSQGEVGIGIEDVNILLPTFTLDGVVTLTAGQQHNCAIRVGGTVWCWGDNLESQMGPLSVVPTDEHLPLEVTGLPVAADIAAGDDHTCVLSGMGEVWCWGDNFNLQLGRGGMDTTDDPIPAQVPMPAGLAAVSLGMGDDHSCAVLSDGTVACWGDDDNGQQGDGAGGLDNGDATLVMGLTDVAQVEGGDDHTCARTNGGQMFCWGDNDNGQLGQGDTNDAPTPVLVPFAAAVDDITLGDNFTCALLANEEVHCWGEGADFQIASGDLVDVLSPSLVLDLPPGDLVDVQAGGRGACIVSAAAERYCWGFSRTGLLGVAPLSQLEPEPVNFSGPVLDLVLSRPELYGLLCGVRGDGTVECSGDGTTVSVSTFSGAAGLFEPISYHLDSPTPIPMLTDVQDLHLADGFGCFRSSTDVQCWGDNSNRQLGQGGTTVVDILTPVPVVGVGVVDELELGDQFGCVRVGGAVECWGDNQAYQTGEGAVTTDQSVPVSVPGLVDAVDIDLGEDHACALRMTGEVTCWGEDGFGQLGDNDGNTADTNIPVLVTGLPPAIEQITVGHDHACALAAGEVYCWGDGGFGQLGQGDGLDSDTALLVPGVSGIVQIEAGLFYTCAVDGAGDVTCWGDSEFGQLGDGGQERTGETEALSPIPFPGITGVLDIVAGEGITCLQTMAGWSCVGFRSAGQVGNGSTLEPAVPVATLFGL